jgi:hypothetical protein
MPAAWAGGSPVEIGDASSYELGTRWRAEETVTITHIAITAGAGEVSHAGRRARLWSAAGVELAYADLPTDLPTGRSEHELSVPVTRTAGMVFVTSYSSYGNYSALTGAPLAVDVPSTDGAVTALADGTGGAGNGVYNQGNPGSFPSTGGNGTYYGVDLTYVLGAGGNTAPEITQLTAVAAGATVTATIVATDEEGLTGAAYRIDWGDGSPPTTGTTSAQHTYTRSGLYAVLASVTDSGGLSDHAAVPVDVDVPDSELQEIDSAVIVDAVASHALALGLFESVNRAEPTGEPSRAGITAAVWVQAIAPYPAASGLRLTSARLQLSIRLYRRAEVLPGDEIDPDMLRAVDRLIAAYSRSFTLGGAVRNVDLLGAAGTPLSAEAGWVEFGSTSYRVMTVTLPLILSNVWEQVP